MQVRYAQRGERIVPGLVEHIEVVRCGCIPSCNAVTMWLGVQGCVRAG